MTMKHRKLFPNGTECTDFCDPFLGFYYTQPPPPPTPPPPPPLPSPLSITNQNDGSHDISPSVIVLVTVFASLLLLLGYYVVVSKSCLGLCRARNDDEDEEAPQPDDGGEEEFIDGNHHHHHVDHPVWFITTVGLQQSIINSITVCRYKKGEGLIEGTDCSVCLNEFREDETLRLLPKCSHAFHIPCIDTWLRSHTNCPLCRAHIIVSDGLGSAVAGGPGTQSAPANQNDDTSANIEETQMGSSVVNPQMSENRLRAGAEDRDDHVDDEEGDCDDQPKEVSILNPEEAVESGKRRRVKRCVSMDSSSVGMNNICELESQFLSESFERSDCAAADDDDGYSSMIKNGLLKRHPSMSHCLRISPVAMKRSFSCGGRFLPSRRNQRPNSFLPL